MDSLVKIGSNVVVCKNFSDLKSPQDEFASSNLVLHTFDTNGLASHQKRKKDKKEKLCQKTKKKCT